MAKISTYTTDTVISASDKLIGTDADSSNATKNFLVSDISAYISSGIATNLAVTNVLNATDTNNQTPSGLDTPLQVLFGIAQGTGTDPVMVDVSGNITLAMQTLSVKAHRVGMLSLRSEHCLMAYRQG
jgi:hypothetical protein